MAWESHNSISGTLRAGSTVLLSEIASGVCDFWRLVFFALHLLRFAAPQSVSDLVAWVITGALLTSPLFMGNCSHRRPLAVQVAPPLHNTAAQAARARLRWRKAIRRVVRLLKVRRLWAELGRYLQTPEVLTLTQV